MGAQGGIDALHHAFLKALPRFARLPVADFDGELATFAGDSGAAQHLFHGVSVEGRGHDHKAKASFVGKGLPGIQGQSETQVRIQGTLVKLI